MLFDKYFFLFLLMSFLHRIMFWAVSVILTYIWPTTLTNLYVTKLCLETVLASILIVLIIFWCSEFVEKYLSLFIIWWKQRRAPKCERKHMRRMNTDTESTSCLSGTVANQSLQNPPNIAVKPSDLFQQNPSKYSPISHCSLVRSSDKSLSHPPVSSSLIQTKPIISSASPNVYILAQHDPVHRKSQYQPYQCNLPIRQFASSSSNVSKITHQHSPVRRNIQYQPYQYNLPTRQFASPSCNVSRKTQQHVPVRRNILYQPYQDNLPTRKFVTSTPMSFSTSSTNMDSTYSSELYGNFGSPLLSPFLQHQQKSAVHDPRARQAPILNLTETSIFRQARQKAL